MLTFLEHRNLELLSANLDYVDSREREWLRKLIIRGEELDEENLARVSKIRASAGWAFTPGGERRSGDA